MAGFESIFREDILRRTYGAAEQFSGGVRTSLNASVFDVLQIYLFEYPGRRTMIVPGKVFLFIILLSVLGIIYEYFLKKENARRHLFTFGFFLLVPVSWFVAAKGHAFTQPHINFVLWYIGFMPALLYVSFGVVMAFVRDTLAFVRRTQSESAGDTPTTG